ncbi:MAG: guanylate kinase [Dehalococcoidia bacterium]|nr:guanylate kinase [Dehalococcoidia bacterium]
MIRNKGEKLKTLHPLLVVISGPSGVGKDATLDIMKKAGLPYHYVVTATTRTKRPGEKDGIDYWFVSENKFQQMVKKNQFLESAKVYDNYYGVPKREVKEAIKKGLDVVVKVDVQGAATIKRILPDALFIFLMPPSTEELANRLKKRYGLSSADLEVRLGKAQEEMESLPIFDYVITSHTNNLDLTAEQVNAAVTAAKCRKKPRVISL